MSRTFNSTHFEAGYRAALNAAEPMEAFEMSSFTDDFVLGFVAGFAECESVRQASVTAWAWQAAELGRLYGVPLAALERLVEPQQDGEVDLVSALRDTYLGVEDEPYLSED